MMIHKIIRPVDYNFWLKRLDIQPNEPTIQNSKALKFLSQRIRKRYYKTLGTSVKKYPMSPLLLQNSN